MSSLVLALICAILIVARAVDGHFVGTQNDVLATGLLVVAIFANVAVYLRGGFRDGSWW